MKWFLILVLFLFGCTDEDRISFKDSVMDDSVVVRSRCTDEEYAKVEAQTKFCNDNTGYRNVFCYQAAFQRNCKREKDEKVQADKSP